MKVQFNDGQEFETSGELRIENRSDGYYVVGDGMLIPVDSLEEAEEVLSEFE